MDFPWYTHHGTSFHGGFIGANSYGNSMEFRWFRGHEFSMVYTPWNLIPSGFIGAKTHGKSIEYWWHKRHGFSMVHAPWNFIPWGLYRDKSPWKLCGEFPWLTFRGNEFQAGFIAARPTETSQKSMAYKPWHFHNRHIATVKNVWNVSI